MFKPIISLAVTILSLGFGFLYVKPAYDRVQGERDNLATLAETFKSTKTIEDLIDQTKKSLDSVDTSARDRFSVFLPEKIDEIRLANNLQSVGTTRGMLLSGIKVTSSGAKESEKKPTPSTGGAPGALVRTLSVGQAGTVGAGAASATGAAKPTSDFAATKVSFTVTATYEGFLLLLSDLEKSLGIMNVTSLSFKEVPLTDEKGNKKSGPTTYEFAVEIETYSLQ